MKKFFKLTILLTISWSMFVGCLETTQMMGTRSRDITQTRISIEPSNTFGMHAIKQVQVPIKDQAKDFTVVRRIFLTSAVLIDGNNRITIDGRSSNLVMEDALQGNKVITYDMLMREALRVGADDIINLVIEIEETHGTTETTSPTSRRTADGRTVQSQQTQRVNQRTIIYRATALAIKYK